MAQKRRGGGFRPPELRGTLGTLLRTTLQQAGVVKDALERGARQGRSRLDEMRADRRRQDALAELGEVVLDLIRRGEIDLGELPEARTLVRQLDELDAEGDAHGHGHRPGHDDDIATPPVRSRFDERAAPPSRRGRDDDGTVSSSAAASARWSPPAKSSPAASRVWRPSAEPPTEPVTEPGRKPIAPPNPHRAGGISFDDEDLADYMHPDDVPPKDPTGGEA